MKFPIYKNDRKPLFIFKQSIKSAVDRVNEKISSGFYKHIPNPCLCGNQHPENDILLAEKDMWGIAVDSLICSQCGLVRSREIPDNASLADFYETDYKNIYYDTVEPGPALFESQEQRGRLFLELLKKKNLIDEIQTVFDYGCGLGGALMPFFNLGKKVQGCDYGEEYLEYGRKKGLADLYHGEINFSKTPRGSQDLVMVSHVMEHFPDPITSMQDIIEIVSPDKYLLVEVPGVFADAPYGYYPIWHLQKGHIFNFFYKDFLTLFFKRLGLEIVFGNERCTFILKKPASYKRSHVEHNIFDSSLRVYPEKVKKRFIDSYMKFDNHKWKNRIRIAKNIVRISELLGLKKLLNSMYKPARQWTS